ncbi:MAG: TatD family hydrolase [Chloroflexi bacterium]|nr:TatD family hydrolase [Chloroflexota bacterium]
MLIDAHCHLNDEQFADDLAQVIMRAHDVGVTRLINAGTNVELSQAAIEMADRYKSVYVVVGIHPEHADTWNDETLEAIRKLAAHRKVVGIGEIGLDFHEAWKENPPREMQERALIAQLDLAAELDKPVVIHDRDAHDALMAILRQRSGKPQGILHCFSGDLAMARQAIELGYFISFACNLTFKNAARLQEIAKELPLDRIVIETDAPYLSPLRGKRNESANVVRVAQKIAELKNIDYAVVEHATTQNSEMLFGLKIDK